MRNPEPAFYQQKSLCRTGIMSRTTATRVLYLAAGISAPSMEKQSGVTKRPARANGDLDEHVNRPRVCRKNI